MELVNGSSLHSDGSNNYHERLEAFRRPDAERDALVQVQYYTEQILCRSQTLAY